MHPPLVDRVLESVFGRLAPLGIRVHRIAITKERNGYRFALLILFPLSPNISSHLGTLEMKLRKNLEACGIHITGLYIDGVPNDPTESN